MEKTEFQYYLGGVKSNIPSGMVSLETFIESHLSPKVSTLKLLEMIAEASSKGDKFAKTRLKEKLPFVTPSVVVDGFRRYDNIQGFTGIAQIDFDDIDDAVALRHYIFEKYKSCICCYVSPSGKGVKGLVRIPVVKSVAEFQEYYDAISEEFEQVDGFDPSPRNAVLPLFWSYDYFMLYRADPDIWEKRGRRDRPKTNPIPLPRVPYRQTKKNDRDGLRALRTYRKAIRGILASPGHPRVRGACIILGTRVGAGYLDERLARETMEYEIYQNAYLQKGLKGYLKTAEWAFWEGLKQPRFY